MDSLFAVPLLSLVLLGTAACGGGSFESAAADGGDARAGDGGDASMADGGDARAADAAVRCDAQTQLSVNDYAHVSGFGTDSCQPLPTACAPHPTCACVLAAFRCGITTTCEEGTLPLQVVCQPD